MDKKFLACLINTRKEEQVEDAETEGDGRNMKALSFIAFCACLLIYLHILY